MGRVPNRDKFHLLPLKTRNLNSMKKIGYTIVFIFCALVLQAQENMTLQRARELALAKNEDIKIAESTLQKSTADQKAARTNYLPSFSAEAMSIYINDSYKKEKYLPTFTPDATTGELSPNVVVNSSTGEVMTGADGIPLFNMYAYLPIEISMQGAYVAGLKIEQPIYTGGKINAGNKMANIGVEMARENIRIKRMNAISEVDEAFWLYVSVQSKVRLAESSLEMYKSLLNRVQNASDAGMATRNDVLKVQVEYEKAILNLQKAQSGLALTRMSLCRITGLSFDTPIVTDSTIVINSDITKQFGNEDVTQRPEYQLLQKNVKLEEQRIKTVRADYLPQVGASAGYNYIGGAEVNSDEISQGRANVMVSVKIPLFNWSEGKQKIASAKADWSIKEYELQKNAGLLRLEIENAKLNLKDAELRIEISGSGLEQANENLRVSNDNYEVGRELLTDRLIAQTQWEQAYNEVIEAKTAYKLQETEYLRVTAKLTTGEN
jgi:outer membrane protein TolC